MLSIGHALPQIGDYGSTLEGVPWWAVAAVCFVAGVAWVVREGNRR